MNIGLVRLFFVASLAGSCISNAQEPAKEDALTGPWNVKSYYFTNTSEIEFGTTGFSFNPDGSCGVPQRYGLKLSLEDGAWKRIDSTHIRLQVLDTMLTGIWTLKNIRYSTVPAYKDVILSYTMCREGLGLCFDLYGLWAPSTTATSPTR